MTEQDDPRVVGASDRMAREEERAITGRRILGGLVLAILVVILSYQSCAPPA